VGLRQQQRSRLEAGATKTHPSPKGGEEWGTRKSKENRRSLGYAPFEAQGKRDDSKNKAKAKSRQDALRSSGRAGATMTQHPHVSRKHREGT